MTLFRYPGGKSKLNKIIQPILSELYQPAGFSTRASRYAEPFFGGGSAGLSFLSKHKPEAITIADKDVALTCLWNAVLFQPNNLCELITDFSPTAGSFYDFKTALSNLSPPVGADRFVWVGFMKLALHQMSYSGLGEMAGGPIGGKSQSSAYPVGCRWNPKTLIRKVHSISELLQLRGLQQCFSFDFETTFDILERGKERVLYYIDPPYYQKGNELYSCGFSKKQHERLAKILKHSDNRWLLSYGDCSEIRELYSWAKIMETSNISSINSKGVVKNELLITSTKG